MKKRGTDKRVNGYVCFPLHCSTLWGVTVPRVPILEHAPCEVEKVLLGLLANNGNPIMLTATSGRRELTNSLSLCFYYCETLHPWSDGERHLFKVLTTQDERDQKLFYDFAFSRYFPLNSARNGAEIKNGGGRRGP